MARGTQIQWADDTCNPAMGCDGCELNTGDQHTCYSEKLHDTRGKGHPGYAPSFEHVTLFPSRMANAAAAKDLFGTPRQDKPWLNGAPRLIFVSDMGDALSAAVSFAYLATEIVAVAESTAGKRHAWLWLTKHPRRMAEFSTWLSLRGISWPSNLWAGTSITSNANVGRVRDLLGVGNDETTRFLSVEPQWERIDPRRLLQGVDWVIQGGESGKHAKPFDVAWPRELRAACEEHGTAYFLKQLGTVPVIADTPLKLLDRHGGDWEEWQNDLRVRELPSRVLSRARGESIRTAGEGNGIDPGLSSRSHRKSTILGFVQPITTAIV